MISIEQIDLMVRGGSITLLALWSWIMLRDHRDALPARTAVAMNLTIICYILSGPLGNFSGFTVAGVATDVASVMAAPAFWLFALVWFNDAPVIGRRNWMLTTAFASLPVVQVILILTTQHFSLFIWTLIRFGMFAYGAAGMWIAWKSRENDLIEARRRLRSSMIWAIGGFVIWVNFVELFNRSDVLGTISRTFTEAAMLAVTFAVSTVLYRISTADLFAANAPATSPDDVRVSPEPSPLALRLRTLMEHDRPYRAERFSIAALAAQMGEQEYRIRRLINGELGFRNFTAFLNSYRLTEIREALRDPAQREVPILTIALDAGFGSLGPFNRAFRDAEGITPSEYRKTAA